MIERFATGVAVDAKGDVYVAEHDQMKGMARVAKFDAGHNLLLSWAASNSSGVTPGAVALDATGHAFVIYANAIMKYALPSAP